MNSLARLIVVCGLAVHAGCGSEDFSEPPAVVAQMQKRAIAKSAASKKEIVPAGPQRADTQEPAKDAIRNSDTLPTSPETDRSVVEDSGHTTVRPVTAVESADGPVTTKDTTATAEETPDSGMSLLERLKAGDATNKSKPDSKESTPDHSIRARRRAVSTEAWARLMNQLTKQFYLAVSADGSSIAASTGDDSLEVRSTGLPLVRTAATAQSGIPNDKTSRQEVAAAAIDEIPGIVTCVELISARHLVLIGTSDGMLLARDTGSLEGWDVYARDLLAYQDERRPTSKLSDAALVMVRLIDSDRLMTIDEASEVRVWRTSDVVHNLIAPLDMTEEQARVRSGTVVKATPVCSVTLPRSRVISTSTSSSGDHCLVVTTAGQAIVFRTLDGVVVDTMASTQFDDTQPVAGIIQEKPLRIVMGLADGRIISRLLAGTESVSGTNEESNSADYDTVFAPKTGDRAGAISAMQRKQDSAVVYVGRTDGSVTHFDLSRNQVLHTERLHNGPVIQICSTSDGAISIGDDRMARIIDVAEPTKGRKTSTGIRLTIDPVLKSMVFIPADASRDQVVLNRNVSVTSPARIDSVAAATERHGSDPLHTLYAHQLRVAQDGPTRTAIRQNMSELREGPGTITEVDSDGFKSPSRISELYSGADFSASSLQRLIMSISNDGNTLSVSQSVKRSGTRRVAGGDPIVVWDTVTGTQLRKWTCTDGLLNLEVVGDDGVLLTRPFTGLRNVFTGQWFPDGASSLSSDRSYRGDELAVGGIGHIGQATEIVTLFQTQTGTTIRGVEAFEGAVPALAWSRDGTSLFASVRERTQTRLLEIDGRTLRIRAEIYRRPEDGNWNPDSVDLNRDTVGATHMLPSPSGNLLVTYGKYSDKPAPYKLHVWKKSGDRWLNEQAGVKESKAAMVECEMTDSPFVFVNQQDATLAVVGLRGVGLISTRTGDVVDELELPDVGTRRPVTMFSPDGKWLLAGDNSGNVWIWSLRSLSRKPRQFAAQAGPIIGLAISDNSQFLATAGEENRIRVWDMSAFLNGDSRSAMK